MQVRRAVIGAAVVELAIDTRRPDEIQIFRRSGNRTGAIRSADVLFRIFKRNTEREIFSRMRDEPELRLPRPDETRLVVRIHVLRVEDIARQRREPLAVRRHKAPVLSAQHFEAVLLYVDKHVTHAERIGVARYKYGGGLIAQEVRLEVA